MSNKLAQKQYIAAQTGAPISSLSESFLRFETILNTQNKIVFNVKENTGTTIPTENRLGLNDAFIITHMALMVKKTATTTPTSADHANADLFPYVNPAAFPGVAGDRNLKSIYNSSLSLSVNNNTQIPAMNTYSFRRVPTSQFGAPIAVGPLLMPSDERQNSLYGYVETDLILLRGSQQIDLNIELPTGWASTFVDTTTQNYAVILVAGYLASNQGTFSA